MRCIDFLSLNASGEASVRGLGFRLPFWTLALTMDHVTVSVLPPHTTTNALMVEPRVEHQDCHGSDYFASIRGPSSVQVHFFSALTELLQA